MKEIGNKLPEESKSDFKGYTMEELRYQRALLALRKEFSKSKVTKAVDSIRRPQRNSGNDGTTAKLARIGSLAGKVFSNLNLLDYVLVGLSVAGSGRKVAKLIGSMRKRKS